MNLLVSLAVAKEHLRVVDNTEDSDIELKLAIASDMVLQHRKLDSVPEEWLDGSPPQIRAPYTEQGVTLAVLGQLHEGREAATIDVESIYRVLSLLDRRPSMA